MTAANLGLAVRRNEYAQPCKSNELTDTRTAIIQGPLAVTQRYNGYLAEVFPAYS